MYPLNYIDTKTPWEELAKEHPEIVLKLRSMRRFI